MKHLFAGLIGAAIAVVVLTAVALCWIILETAWGDIGILAGLVVASFFMGAVALIERMTEE